jgi:hypothetical protein
MSWVAWRVQRGQILAVIFGLVAVGTFLAVLGELSTTHVTGQLRFIAFLSVAGLLVLPCLVGLVVGAESIGAECQHATNRFAWSQDITRLRWAFTKLAVGAAVVFVPLSGLAVLLGWWATKVPIPHSVVVGGFYGRGVAPFAFDVTGPVIVAYALFSFALGALLGAILARPGWAVALGAALFTAARVVVQIAVRPHLATPDVLTDRTGVIPPRFNSAWILHQGWLPAGRLSPPAGGSWAPFPAQCLSSTAPLARCAQRAHLHFVAVFQPASHYWALQTGETAIFIGAAIALAALSILVVARRSA